MGIAGLFAGVILAVQATSDENSRLFYLRKWQVSDEESWIHIQGTWDSVSYNCLMMETVGIPCSHLFSIMKVENLDAIPHCMILSRWTKEAKLGVSSGVQDIWT